MPTSKATIKLTDPVTFEKVKIFFERIVREDSVEETQLFRLNLIKLLEEQKVKEANVTLYQGYEKMSIQTSLVTLFLLNDGEVLNIIEKHFTSSLEMELYDFWGKLRYKLISIATFSEREDFKKKAWEALERNQEQITVTNLLRGGSSKKGTVANWLVDFRAASEEDKGSRFGLTEYLTSSKNIGSLSDKERKAVEKLLKLYSRLRISSFDLEGVEEPMVFIDREEGKITIFKDGVFEDITKERRRAKISSIGQAAPGALQEEKFEKIRARYEGNDEENKSIAAERASLSKLAEEQKALINYLKKALESRDKIKTIAVLYVLAEQRKLDDILRGDNFISRALQDKLKGADEKLRNFQINPAAARYLVMFLRFALEDKLGLSSNESARWGLRIINILKSKGINYRQLVYFDMEDKLFKWI